MSTPSDQPGSVGPDPYQEGPRQPAGQDTRAPGEDVPRQGVPVHDLYGPGQQQYPPGQGQYAAGQPHGAGQPYDAGQGYGAGQQGAYSPYGAYPDSGNYAAPGTGPRSYLDGAPVGFGQAIKDGFQHVVTWRGRASRPAYWWFFLFNVAAGAVISGLYDASRPLGITLNILIGIPLALAGLALTIRRLHDTNRTGWWCLIGLIPIVGTIVLLVFCLMPGTPGPNRYTMAR